MAPLTVLPNFPSLPHGVLSNQQEDTDIFGCATWQLGSDYGQFLLSTAPPHSYMDCKHTYTHTYIHACMHNTHAHTHTHTHTHTQHAHVYTLMCMHTHTHTQTHKKKSSSTNSLLALSSDLKDVDNI